MKHMQKFTYLLVVIIVAGISISLITPDRPVAGQTTDTTVYLPLLVYKFPPITKIAFQTERDGNREIYLIDSEGQNPTRLTNNTATDFQHSWSPDGKHLVYASNQDGNYEIYRVDVDGSNRLRLTNDSASDTSPSWSPDGQKIVFATTRHGSTNAEIYVMNSDGSNLVRLTDNSTNDGSPTWSPDGTKIAYVNGGVLSIMDADGSNPNPITSRPEVYVYEFQWSPNGNQIAFRGETSTFNQEIYVVQVNGSGLTNLSQSTYADLYPRWSPDGFKLAYSCNFSLCLINPDGSDQVVLTPLTDYRVDWSPDGNRIAFSGELDGISGLYSTNMFSTDFVRLTDDGSDYWPVWQSYR